MIEIPRLNRARLYVLFDAFEQDIRNIIENTLLDHLSEENALGPDFKKANELREQDTDDASVSIVHYLYLRQAYDVLSRQRNKLARDLADEIRFNTAKLNDLVAIRNRVMHGRPLRGDDPENSISTLRLFTTRYWSETHAVLHRLSEDVSWEPTFEALPLASERILHNLPLADYDETGLIGRSDDVLQLKRLVQKRREPIITITGEGGIGKTALALEVAYSVVDDTSSDFDCVLWVSLKNEMLTAAGVRRIENAVRDITGIANELGAVLDKSFKGSVQALGEALQGINSLIVLDNLESAQGEEVIELYDMLPDSVTYLFTSRVGVGQIERRIALGPLKELDADLLFRKLASSRAPHLARAKKETLKIILSNLRYSPLAIKWYILSVEAGKEPASTLRDQAQLIEFCISNVYEGLSEKAKTLLNYLDALDRSTSFDELAVLTEMPIDELRTSAHELGRGSLVNYEPDPDGGLISRLALSVAARMFLQARGGRDEILAIIRAREKAYRTGAERRRNLEQSRALGPNFVRTRNIADQPVVHLLDLALLHSKQGQGDKAMALIERARSLNPEYWEVDRVAGFIASRQRRNNEAVSLYNNALGNVQTDEEDAVVKFFLAGHLARSLHDLDAAWPLAIQAHKVLCNSDTALLLGNMHVWGNFFETGQTYLNKAKSESSGKTYLIACTAYVESYRRWAESLSEQHMVSDALQKAFLGFQLGAEVISEGIGDRKLTSELLDCIIVSFRLMSEPASQADVSMVDDMCDWVSENHLLARSSPNWSILERFFTSIFTSNESGVSPLIESEYARDKIAAVLENSGKSSSSANQLVGEVISWAGRYGFISHPKYPKNVFFHRGSLVDPNSNLVSRGSLVIFEHIEGSDGKDAADNVRLFASNL